MFNATLLRPGTGLLVVFTALAVPAVASAADAQPAATSLFNGRNLDGWKPSAFDSQTEVKVVNPFRDGPGAIVVAKGTYLSGITWKDASVLPRMNYEISLEAMKTEGNDFFCGLTFPVGETAVTFVVGGWGGSVTGISCVDNSDASDNDTSSGGSYHPNQWYRVRVRVTPKKLEAWIDDEQVVDLETTGRKLDLRFGDISYSLPLGLATYETGAAYRNIQLRRLPKAD